MARNNRDQGVETHFCYDLSLRGTPPVLVGICGYRTLDPAHATTIEAAATCENCKRCLAARHREEIEYAI